MSDFNQLLGKLQATAQKVATSKKRKTHEEGVDDTSSNCAAPPSRKRKGASLIRRPVDFHDLTINISFLCIGAQKAGTTWLHQMLNLHPDLCLPDQKEVHFWDWYRRKGLHWYSCQFQQQKTRHEAYFGEITPCYAVLQDHDIGEIRYLFPELKIIFIARDLLSRAWSALLMELRNSTLGLEAGEFAKDHMSEIEKDKLLREADPNQYDDDYFMDKLQNRTHSQRSDYASGLRRWLNYFPKDQLLILDYNNVSKKPRELLRQIYGFIGVKDDIVDSLDDDVIKKRFNVASDPKLNPKIRPSLQKKMETHLQQYTSDFNILLEELGYKWRLGDE